VTLYARSEGHSDQNGKPEVRDLCRQCLGRPMSLILTFCATYSDTNVINSEILQFRYDSVRLPDPNPKLGIEEVRTAFSATYPEIATAAVTGPEAIGNKLVYHFAKAIGVKG
jgi:PRTRC genetic system protein C